MSYLMRVTINESKVQELLDRIEKATDEIQECYHQLGIWGECICLEEAAPATEEGRSKLGRGSGL